MSDTLEPADSGPEAAPGAGGPFFETVNAEGAAPVLLLCDHASNFIPSEWAALGLDEAHLARHIAWDIGAAEVTRQLARSLDAPAILSHFSRLLVDPNRQPGVESLIPEQVDGVTIPGNLGLSAVEKERRLATFHRPYHQAVEQALDRLAARGPGPAVISVHSFTPVMEGVERPWQVAILWNTDPRLPQPLIGRLRDEGLMVGDNEPYSGRHIHGYTMQHHADPRGLANVLIELRQDLIDTRHGAAEWAEVLERCLVPVLADPSVLERGVAA